MTDPPPAAPVRLGITVGDPAGIGPEVVLRALADPERPAGVEIAVYGPRSVLADRAARFSLAAVEGLEASLFDLPLRAPCPLGVASPEGGRAAAEAVKAAAADALAGRIDAMVTAPLNKEALHAAGLPWPGHTEMLADLAGTPDVAMMFVGGALRVALLTIHRSLRSVPDAVTGAEVRRVAHLVARELRTLGLLSPRIALCALNPHAGEGGLFGDEEDRVLRPAIAALRGEGLDIAGPFPADSLFVRASRGEWDAVLAGYHDQGLIPVKLLSFGHAVNVTLGLPFVRTSVDHGTGFDIVEKGAAEGKSLVEAMRVAVAMARARLAAPRA